MIPPFPFPSQVCRLPDGRVPRHHRQRGRALPQHLHRELGQVEAQHALQDLRPALHGVQRGVGAHARLHHH